MHEVLAKIYSEYYDSCFVESYDQIIMITNPMTYNRWYDYNKQHIKKLLRKYKLEKIKAVNRLFCKISQIKFKILFQNLLSFFHIYDTFR